MKSARLGLFLLGGVPRSSGVTADFRATTGTFATSLRPGISAVQRPRRSSARRCAATCSVTLENLDLDMAARWMKNSQVVKKTSAGHVATEGQFCSENVSNPEVIFLKS